MSDHLWQPPSLYAQVHETHSEDEERKVTWLELFYDLVYVATLIQLGNWLSENVSLLGFLGFVALFVPIWWSWTGITFYVNRFVVDDVWHRLLIFIQIAAIAALAISVEGAYGELGAQFTLSYVAIRLVLVALYFRAGKHVPRARALTNRYAWGFMLVAMIWFVAAFVPAPYRYLLWAIGMLADFAVPLSSTSRRLTAELPVDVPHMMERYGLFTIIVLGESFVKVISNASGEVLGVSAFVVGLFGLAIACCLWWLYFGNVAVAEIKRTGWAAYVWIYSHLPIAIALTAFGVGITKVFLLPAGEPLPDKYRWLISVALILYLVFVALIDLSTRRSGETSQGEARARNRFVAVVLIALLATFGAGLSPVLFMAVAATIYVSQVVTDLMGEARVEREAVA